MKTKSKTPCDKCVGKNSGCSLMSNRDPKKECKAFAEVGKNVISFKNGSKKVF